MVDRRKISLIVDNIHCPSCVASITDLISQSPFDASQVSVSILSGSVTFLLPFNAPANAVDSIQMSLRTAGYVVVGEDALPIAHSPRDKSAFTLKWWEPRAAAEARQAKDLQLQQQRHRASCRACQEEDLVEGEGLKGKPRASAHESDHGSDEITTMVTSAQQEAQLLTVISITGMTCSSCVGNVRSILSPDANPLILEANVTLLPGRAVIRHSSKLIDAGLKEMIEDGGYDAAVVSSVRVGSKALSGGERQVKLRIDGMFCGTCVNAINSLLHDLHGSSAIRSFTPLTLDVPFINVVYLPVPPTGFTLRTLRDAISSLGPFSVVPVHGNDTLDDLARAAQRRETQSLSIRLGITFVFAIPTFVIAVVGMSILGDQHPFRNWLETPIWGSAQRGTVALFFLATPVQFGIGSLFYSRAWKGVRGVWRRDGKGKWKDRLLRWGSMDSLVALGTSTAYFASLVSLILTAVGAMEPAMSYFDASVFLMLFILLGRLFEGISKRKTGDSVSMLGKMKPVTGILYHAAAAAASSIAGDGGGTQTVEADFIEVGDIVLIPPGSAVPLDSILIDTSSSSSFDEASLTGESLPVLKHAGDLIFAGTINLSSAVIVRVEKHSGDTVIDGIVDAVRDAMSRKASIERLADGITGYFVPSIVGIAVFTFLVWIIRGYSGALPVEWLDQQGGSWVSFAVQFAVSVLVVSCPCGIGLAAPTAQMVGIGICARLGIVPYGGGEGFQSATKIDCVVFDKTGTLTSSLFVVSDHYILPGLSLPLSTLWRMLEAVEESSAHPISVGLRSFCHSQLVASTDLHPATVVMVDSSETPGRGLQAELLIDDVVAHVIVGNALFMSENKASYGGIKEYDVCSSKISQWSSEGSSIVLVAISTSTPASYQVVALFGVEDSLRPEAAYVVSELERQGICVFVCSGDNRTTTLAVAGRIGIGEDRVFAGVLPLGKSDCIERLQNGAAAQQIMALRGKRSWWKKVLDRRTDYTRAKVLFVGDGINDLAALTQANVGVSMGAGSAVALASSDFCLLSSNLHSLITVLAISRSTFNKIISNFVWACLFNVCLIPIAAGALYSFNRTTLPPVWSSLAMALSSVSVVLNSLLLRWTFTPPRMRENDPSRD